MRPGTLLFALLGLTGSVLFALLPGCASVNGSVYPSCADVWKYRPDLGGKIVCHMPASPSRQAEATRAAIQRNADQRTIRAGVLDAERAIQAGKNP